MKTNNEKNETQINELKSINTNNDNLITAINRKQVYIIYPSEF